MKTVIPGANAAASKQHHEYKNTSKSLRQSLSTSTKATSKGISRSPSTTGTTGLKQTQQQREQQESIIPSLSGNQNCESVPINQQPRRSCGSSSVVSFNSAARSTSNVARSDTHSYTSRASRPSPRHATTPPPNCIIKRGKAGNSPGKQGKQGKVGANQNQIIPSLGFGGPKISAELYAQQFPGALPLESEVFCWYPAQRAWFSATVIHARSKSLIALPSEPPSSRPISSQSSSVSGRLSNAGAGKVAVSGKVPVSGKIPVGGKSVPSSPSLASGTLIPVVTSVHSNYLTPKAAEDAVVVIPFEWDGREAEYDYYIHFHGEDRRQDMWVVASLLRPVDFEFHPEEPCISKPPGPDDIHKHMDADYLREHEENTKLKTIGKIQIGEYLVETWYFSPYPKEFQNLDVLYICEYCLNFFKYECELILHSRLCSIRHPPGDEIYRDTVKNISVFEVDGSLARQYTENLCFLSKLFLDHKTLRHPVYLFLFYVVTERTKEGHRVVGYFSKEKYSKNNLSCIMCLPQHQRKGYGQFLINLSYALSRKEGKRGTPERPLSDLGKATYIKYWAQTSVAALLSPPLVNSEVVTIEQIAQETSIEAGDIAMALEAVGVLRYHENTPFIFLPTECVQAASKWCRAAFINQVLPSIHNLPLSELGLNDNGQPLFADMVPSLNGDSSPAKTQKIEGVQTENTASPNTTAAGSPKAPERRSKRRRSALGWGDDWETKRESEPSGKKIKTQQGRQSIAKLEELSAGASPSSSSHSPVVKDSLDVSTSPQPPQIIPIKPINLQDLRWESYDLHLGPYEYAPVTT